MNKDQFIYWLKGFAKAVNEEGPTPGQWGIIASELGKIKDCPDYGSPIEKINPNPMWQEPHYVNPWDKYKITCGTSGSGTTQGIITNGNTSITTKLPENSTLTYTIKDDSKDS